MGKPTGPRIPVKRVANAGAFRVRKIHGAMKATDTTNVPDPKGFVDRMVITMADAKLYGYVRAIQGDGQATLERWCAGAKELIQMELHKMERELGTTANAKELKAHSNLTMLLTLPAASFFRAINNILNDKGIRETYRL